MSSASVRSIQFLSCPNNYCAHLYMKYSLGISNFLEEISSLSCCIFFPLFLCIIHLGRLSYLSLLFLGTLHSDGCIFPFLHCLSLLFFSQFVRPPQTNILPFFFLGMVLISASCTVLGISIHSSSGTLLDLIPWNCLSLPLCNRKGFHLGHTWMA